MVNRTVIASLLAAAFLSIQNAEAQNVIVGAGASDDSCGNWIQARRSKDIAVEQVFVSWMQGHLSGRNVGMPGDASVSLPAPTVISAYLDRECAKSPTLPVFIFSEGLYFQLQRQQGRVGAKK
jgi:hypothetical protein